MTTVVLGALLTAAALAGCSGSPSAHQGSAAPRLKISGAYVTQPPMSDMTAGYFTLTNTGAAPDKLTGVTSSFASDISMNTTNATGQMLAAASFTVPAHGTLVFRTGADHLMIMGMRHKPVVGETVPLELHFTTSAPITVQVPVEPLTYQPAN
ncbi:copper chaperone PCu(A)C [Streptacidiphilus sp. PB12-B1b]|nr:copper chaperone PCu(A)C [Streptacidiphilus sp. PB12-B1b]